VTPTADTKTGSHPWLWAWLVMTLAGSAVHWIAWTTWAPDPIRVGASLNAAMILPVHAAGAEVSLLPIRFGVPPEINEVTLVRG